MRADALLEQMLLLSAQAESFDAWDDALSDMVRETLARYPSAELSEDALSLAAGGVAPLMSDPDHKDEKPL